MAIPEKTKKGLEEMQRDPKAFRRKARAKVKRENPEMTEEQLDALDELSESVFGV